ncbi:hypothetical protein [Mycobacteroides abscessus]|uniref:hypothetical protein n=1 Tax=Mycobacteroides abscessus TaxID=36809 RepID=UPI00104F6E08|nr:hypothetical protein [Mycobacteroides abscessus]
MSALLGELRGLDNAWSAGARLVIECPGHPRTPVPSESPLTSTFAPVGTRQCLLSGSAVPREKHPDAPDAGNRARRGG